MIYKIFANGYTPVLHISSISYAFQKKSTYFGPKRKRAYIVHYVLNGKGLFNGIPVSAGQGFLTTPEDTIEYHSDETDPWGYLWFVSRDPKMADIFSTYHVHPGTQIFDYNCVEDARALAKNIVLHNRGVFSSLLLSEYFLRLYNKHSLQSPPESHAKNYMEYLSSYVENNIHSAIKIDTLTSLLGVSQQYLYRICKEHYGVSPKEYISSRKLFYAKKMLKETKMTATEIGNAIGFDDVLAFSKFFSRHVGISPMKYRKS